MAIGKLIDKNIEKIILIIFSISPLIFLFGVAINNTLSVLIALYGIYIVFFKKNYFLLLNKFIVFYSILIFILILTSYFYAIFFEVSVKSAILYTPYIFYFIAGVFLFYKFKKKNLELLYNSIIVSILILTIFSVNNYFIETKLYETVVSESGEQLKLIYDPKIDGLKSIFENKILGIYLVKIYPLFFGLIFYLNKKLDLFKIILILSISLQIFFSFNRTSIVFFILINLIYFSYFLINKIELKKVLTIVFSLVALIVTLYSTKFDNLYFKTKNQLLDDDGINIYPKHHLGHYKTTLNIIKDNFFTGVGTDSFRYTCSLDKYVYYYRSSETLIDKYGNPVKINSCSTHPHNIYLQLFSENGFFAFSILLIFYLIIIKETFLNFFKKHEPKNMLYLSCLISTLCSFLPIAPSPSFYNTYLNAIIYFPIMYILFYNLKIKNNLILK